MLKKWSILLIGMSLFCGCSNLNRSQQHKIIFDENIEIEYGTDISSAKFVKRVDSFSINDSMIDKDTIHVSNFTVNCPKISNHDKLGETTLTYLIGEDEYTVNATVVDTTKPVISLEKEDLVFEVNEMKDMTEYFSVSDNYDKETDIKVDVEGKLNKGKVGTYDLTIIATDSSANTSAMDVTVTIKDTKKEEEEKRKEQERKQREQEQKQREEQQRQQEQQAIQNQTQSSGSSYSAPSVNPSITSRDYLFSAGYDMSTAPSACQADLLAYGGNGSCTPIQDADGIYLGMHLSVY